MTIPKLESGRFGVVLAESATGKVLSIHGDRYADGGGEFYAVFESFKAAEEYARSRVEGTSGIEASIRNYEGEHLVFVRELQ
jgi:hypothetical protein